jgi:LasA protease
MRESAQKILRYQGKRYGWFLLTWILCILVSPLLTGCQTQSASAESQPSILELPGAEQSSINNLQSPIYPTPFPTRPAYEPGQLVDYVVQTGDTLPALAVHFNTTEAEIREANPIIPADATTLPPGMPMQIPIYYQSFWGSPYQILPDSLFINGPAQADFDTAAFLASQHGWIRDYQEYAAGARRDGAQMVDYVAVNFSISPRVLLALLEYQLGALSQPDLPSGADPDYPLGYIDSGHRGLYLQLIWATNLLNNGYYGWRTGHLTSLDHQDGTMERPDPWQNAATVALQYYFSLNLSATEYRYATGSEGFARVYQELFGDPWTGFQAHIPGSLRQPEFLLPFEGGKTWAYTGGPHTGWGTGEPWAAMDFAPPSVVGGCKQSNEWATAVAEGIIARTDVGVVELDLDGDGDPRSGWVILYLHIETRDKAAVGTQLAAGAQLGHPSCEGGTSTGTHIHIARKYNGEWIPAEGPLAFVLEGWEPHNGENPYQGTLTRFSQTVVACDCSNKESQVTAAKR